MNTSRIATLACLVLAAAVATVSADPHSTHHHHEVIHRDFHHGDFHHDHHLQRRQLETLMPVSLLTGGIGGGAIHKNHANQRLFHYISDKVHALEADVKQLETSAPTVRLERRVLGTITGSIGISRSKKLRKQIGELDTEVHSLRDRVDRLMALEGVEKKEMPREETEKERKQRRKEEKKAEKEEKKRLKQEKKEAKKHHRHGDEKDHKLERRQVGIVVAPVSMHKNRHDRRTLEEMADFVAQIAFDVERVKTAQVQRLGRRPTRSALGSARQQASGSIRPRHAPRGKATLATAQGERVIARVRVTTSSDVKHEVEQD